MPCFVNITAPIIATKRIREAISKGNKYVEYNTSPIDSVFPTGVPGTEVDGEIGWATVNPPLMPNNTASANNTNPKNKNKKQKTKTKKQNKKQTTNNKTISKFKVSYCDKEQTSYESRKPQQMSQRLRKPLFSKASGPWSC